MKAWGLTEDQIRDAARDVGLSIHGEWLGRPTGGIVQDGRALRFRLGVDSTAARDANGYLPFQRRSMARWHEDRPRRIAAVCWHGHRAFMRAAFALNPDARIKTVLADYRGADDFERTHEQTQGQGNAYNLSYEQACACHETAALAGRS